MSDFFRCPNCAAEVPVGEVICRFCGSDERTGWSPNTLYDGMNLPGWEDGPRPLRFWDTLLWRDLKILIGLLLLLSFVAISLRF